MNIYQEHLAYCKKQDKDWEIRLKERAKGRIKYWSERYFYYLGINNLVWTEICEKIIKIWEEEMEEVENAQQTTKRSKADKPILKWCERGVNLTEGSATPVSPYPAPFQSQDMGIKSGVDCDRSKDEP